MSQSLQSYPQLPASIVKGTLAYFEWSQGLGVNFELTEDSNTSVASRSHFLPITDCKRIIVEYCTRYSKG